VRAVVEGDVCVAQAGELGHAQPSLDREQQQGVVAATEPGAAIGCREQRVDLCLGEERHDRSVGAFGLDRDHARDQLGVFGVSQRGEAKQRVHRREPRVAGARTVAAVGLEVFEEREDQGRVEILEL